MATLAREAHEYETELSHRITRFTQAKKELAEFCRAHNEASRQAQVHVEDFKQLSPEDVK